MNKKQREAKRKNAQQHQKKMRQLNKERESRYNLPQCSYQPFRQFPLAKPQPKPSIVDRPGTYLTSPEPVSGVLDDPLIDTFDELHRALTSDGDIGATIASVIRARTQHDDVLEGEFQVVEDTVKQLK